MCGITGWLSTPGGEPAPGALGDMARAIRHRGPDDAGEYREPSAGLLHEFVNNARPGKAIRIKLL